MPYKRLKEIFNLEGKARPGRHPVHNIGNLTYISHGLNSYKTGIGPDPLKLDTEPPENLKAHLLMDQEGDLLKAYNNACPNGDLEKAKQYFDKFSKKRRMLITEALLFWIEAILRGGRLSGPINESPAEHLIRLQDDDLIQKWGYPTSVAPILITLRKMKGMVKRLKKGADLSYGFKRKLGKRRTEQVVRVDLYRSPMRIEEKEQGEDSEY